MSQFDSKTAGSVRCLEQTVSPMPGETCSPVVWVFPWFVIESFPSLLLHQAAPLPVSGAKIGAEMPGDPGVARCTACWWDWRWEIPVYEAVKRMKS